MSWFRNKLDNNKIRNFNNPYTIKVPFCNGNRYVISDIHGCLNTLKALIKTIVLKNEDQLFLLGDYIDRGPDSVGVIDYIIDLQQSGFNVFPIRGNHEEDLLIMHQYMIKNLIVKYIKNQNTSAFFDSNLELKNEYLIFFQSLPYFIELEDFFLVHAGFDFNASMPYEKIDDMISIRNWPYNHTLAKNKTIVHGHNPMELKDIQNCIDLREKVIPLDNGCVFDSVLEMGNLLCLELRSFNLICQNNIDEMSI